jgi:hypothetical protein
VNVISIKGTECALEDLGRVCEMTGGSVERVDPLDLSKNFSSVLSNPVIATNVSCRFLLHDALSFRNEEGATNVLVKDVGNVTADTELSFEFAPGDKIKQYPELASVPFQLQVHFSTLAGMKLQRVITRTLDITHDRKEAERMARVDVLSANAIQQCSKLATRGMYRHARKTNLRAARILARKAAAGSAEEQFTVSHWASDAFKMDDIIDQQDRALRAQLRSEGWDQVSSDSDTGDEESEQASRFKIKGRVQRKSKTALRRKAAKKLRNDNAYHNIRTSAKANSRTYSTPVPASRNMFAQRQAPVSETPQARVPVQGNYNSGAPPAAPRRRRSRSPKTQRKSSLLDRFSFSRKSK